MTPGHTVLVLTTETQTLLQSNGSSQESTPVSCASSPNRKEWVGATVKAKGERYHTLKKMLPPVHTAFIWMICEADYTRPLSKRVYFHCTVNNGAILKGITRRLVALQSCISRLTTLYSSQNIRSHIKEQVS